MSTFRNLAEDVHFGVQQAEPASAHRLSLVESRHANLPVAASPARELQQRLESSVLRSFYAEAEPARSGLAMRMAVVVGSAVIGWAAVFGSAYLLFG